MSSDRTASEPQASAPGRVRHTDAALLERYARDVSGLIGAPEAVIRPRDVADVAAVLREAAATQTPVLPVGGMTSTTGASVAERGWVLDMRGFAGDRLGAVDPERGVIRAAPGVSLQAVRDAARGAGWELAADPTSIADCTVGGAIACNASGPSTFRYGAMARHVAGVTLVDGAGTTHALRRPRVDKCSMGPPALQDPLQWVVGSEGLFGVIVDAEIALVPFADARRGLWLPLARAADAAADHARLSLAIRALRAGREPLGIKAVEWLDGACCALLAGLPDGTGGVAMPTDPSGPGALYVELEAFARARPPGARDASPDDAIDAATEAVIEALGDAVDHAGAQALVTDAELRAFGALRHRVPETNNQRGRQAQRDAGGGKLSTDWSVPVDALADVLTWSLGALAPLADDGRVQVLRYGHLGNAHPHFNLICADAEAKAAAWAVIEAQLARVGGCGGSLVSEHGVGKLKRPLVAPYLPPGFVAALAGLKRRFDPASILAQGNVAVLPPAS